MGPIINVNADLGEGYGRYDVGDDAALLGHVSSANIACGAHAGDPKRMRRTVAMALEAGASIGAHPGYPDVAGFGRRELGLTPEEIEAEVAAQIGALQTVAALEGGVVTHVKTHGALYHRASDDAAAALAVVRAIRAADPRLIHLGPPRTELERASREAGLAFAAEGFADRAYESTGRLASRRRTGAVYADPALAAAQAVSIATEGALIARTGETIALEADSICIHGDGPCAATLAEAVRAALEGSGVHIADLPMVISRRP